MSDTTKKLSVQELDKNSSLVSLESKVVLIPRHSTRMYGNPGSKYRLAAINQNGHLYAHAYADNGGEWIMNNVKINPLRDQIATFTMNEKGFITVYNSSTPDPSHRSFPKVMFLLTPTH